MPRNPFTKLTTPLPALFTASATRPGIDVAKPTTRSIISLIQAAASSMMPEKNPPKSESIVSPMPETTPTRSPHHPLTDSKKSPQAPVIMSMSPVKIPTIVSVIAFARL